MSNVHDSKICACLSSHAKHVDPNYYSPQLMLKKLKRRTRCKRAPNVLEIMIRTVSMFLTYRHACAVGRVQTVLQATLVVSVVDHPWKHSGKFKVMLCRFVIKTVSPSFAEEMENVIKSLRP